jgi:hypothetical protein
MTAATAKLHTLPAALLACLQQPKQSSINSAAVAAGCPPAVVAAAAAFGWARKQAPELSLAQLGKLFRQRQVSSTTA